MLYKIALTASLVGALSLAGIASAGNGAGAKTSSSISGPVVVSSTTVSGASTATPSYGDTITFNVSTSATDQPFVNLVCYQNGALVANGWGAFFGANAAGTFTLTSGAWTGGAADCTASLGMYVSSDKYKVLASTSFHVNA